MEQEKLARKLFDSPKLDLASFEILETIGTGTFSRVRLAKFKEGPDSRPIALKILKKHALIKLKQTENIRNEKLLLEKLLHPSVPRLLGT